MDNMSATITSGSMYPERKSIRHGTALQIILSLNLPVINKSAAGTGSRAAPRSPNPGMRRVAIKAKNVSRINSHILNFFVFIPLKLSKGIFYRLKNYLL
jgi:hypothetical protein